LNESADQVELVSDGGVTTNRLGALAPGLHTISLSITGAFQVIVFKVSPLGFLTPIAANKAAVLQISQDALPTRFNSPRGLAVNTDPVSPNFGRVYVANSVAGTATNTQFGPTRQLGDGLYGLNSDLSDATGQGDSARTCGLRFTNSDLVPSRLTVGSNNFLYVCDPSEETGSLYQVAPDLAPNSGVSLLGGPPSGEFPVGLIRNHGGISAAVVTGALENTNLTAYVLDNDLQIDPNTTLRTMLNSLWIHEIYEVPGSPGFPGLVLRSAWLGLTPQLVDLSQGTNYLFYVTAYRSERNDRAGLYVVSRFGEMRWNSLDQSRLLSAPAADDLLGGAGGIAIHPNYGTLAVMNQDTNIITLLRLKQGLPDLAGRLELTAFPSTPGVFCDVSFDAAGNLYAISAGAQALRVFSPGGATTAITGSDGSFTMIRPPSVSVSAPVTTVREAPLAQTAFTLHRTGDLTSELQVSFEFGGSAGSGIDYQAPPLTATFPAGAKHLDVPLLILDDELPELPETITLHLLGTSFYDVCDGASATLVIADDDPPLVQIRAVQTNAHERFAATQLQFELERLGDTNSAFSIGYALDAGTARPELDFGSPNGAPISYTVRFAPGQARATLTFVPKDDAEVEPTESVIVGLLQDIHPVLDVPMQATGWITDDDSAPMPVASVAFAEDFEDTTRAGDWLVRFGANNGIFDAYVGFGADYSLLGVPPSPGSALGKNGGLVLEVNKTNSTPGGSCGINLYPQSFTIGGDFALRFDLFMSLGPFARAEQALAGINHSGQLTNRVTQSFDPVGTSRGGDGLWVALSGEDADTNTCVAYSFPSPLTPAIAITNRAASEMREMFPSPPYASAGEPGVELSSLGEWTQVELSQARGMVTLRLNNRVVYSFTNNTAFTNGMLMLGLNDPFDSIGLGGAEGNFVVFDNVRVYTYDPAIRSVAVSSNFVNIEFVSPAAGSVTDFRVESSMEFSRSTSWREEETATITATLTGFSAQVPRAAPARYYRIKLLRGG
jgi:hypothetical protein